MGTMIQAQQAGRSRLSRRGNSPIIRRTCAATNDVLNYHAAADHRGDPPPVPRSRRRHHRDEHVQLQRHLHGGLRPGRPHLRSEYRRGAGRAARRGSNSSPRNPGSTRFVAGSMGPTSRTASMSQDVNSPASRGVTFDQLREVYYEQARGLVEGGVDFCWSKRSSTRSTPRPRSLPSTNISRASGQRVSGHGLGHHHRPSGRTLSGQTVEAFWISVSHMDLLSVGINCALGAKQMRPYIEELSRLAPIHISCYPNAGLPNAFGGFDETPERMAADLRDFARNGWLNIAGGCCGIDARAHPRHCRSGARTCRRTCCRSRSATRASAGSSRW